MVSTEITGEPYTVMLANVSVKISQVFEGTTAVLVHTRQCGNHSVGYFMLFESTHKGKSLSTVFTDKL